MTTLILPEIATIGNIEKSCYDLFNNSDDAINHINLDFSKVIFIEPSSSTTYLIAFINTCIEKKISFKVTPPKNNGIRIILYTWRFFEVLEETTNIPVSVFAPTLNKDFSIPQKIRLTSTKNRILGYYNDIDNQDYKKYFKDRYLNEESIIFLTTTEKFFPLTSLNFSTEDSKYEEFENEKERWNNVALIREILYNNLNNIDIETKFTDNVICEALSNAIIHPNSNKFFTGSFFDFKDTRKSKNSKSKPYMFTLNFWDNGESIIKTLREPLNKSLPVKSEKSVEHFYTETNTDELLFIIKKEGYKYNILKSSAVELNKYSQDDQILLASFFPGISRNPNREYGSQLGGTHPGLGLSLLMNTVVNELEGELAIRTGKYFLNIRKANKGDKMKYRDQNFGETTPKVGLKDIFKGGSYFAAKISILNNKMPSFRGNMITARIPIKYKPLPEDLNESD